MSTKHPKSKDGINRDKKSNKPAESGISGGNMGAGKSGSENLGSEKPSNDETLGSQRPPASHKKK